MEIKILENEPKKLVFQLIGADHTLCNALKKELLLVKGVEIATYAIEHPQIGIPKFHIETTSGKPKKALEDALKNLKKNNQDFLKSFSSAK
ncbi:MAG: RpoL/Rpb11 RNA polymerase subunit family protein [Candidatus Nanoarchaeia archaeon]